MKKTEVVVMARKRSGSSRRPASFLLAFMLAGCAAHAAVPGAGRPNAERATMQRPARVIISFQRPAADSTQVSAAIAQACRCQPVFIRPYLNNALIYEVALPQGLSLATFKNALMADGVALGIQGVEEDIIEHPYTPR